MTVERVPTFCALCISRCGATATIEDGVLKTLEPDPSHPTGKSLCIKGKVASELVYHPERLTTPLERTRPKGDPDPGWRALSWDEALGKIAARLRAIASESGPEAVVFSAASPSTSAISDTWEWIHRLRRAFGSPNCCAAIELCGWGRFVASSFTFGAPVPGLYLPDLEHAGCIVYWGYNPSVARLSHATATTQALNRGARLIVVDPRRVGFARRADEWLRVRPGTDAALALSISRVMIERGWFDREFVQTWTNGPLLVRLDSGRLLRESDLDPAADSGKFVALSETSRAPISYDPTSGSYAGVPSELMLLGEVELSTTSGKVRCKPAFQLAYEEAREQAPAATGIDAEQVERTARLLWESRPVAYYAWSGVEQHSDSTQIARAIAQLYALTGSFDARGGNVRFPAAPSNPHGGAELLSKEQRKKALGLERRPLGPGRAEFVTADDLYTAALEGKPYRARALVGFGANLLLASADPNRGREALKALDFYVHADLFMNPTAELADIVLPVASPFESEALAIGFEISPDAEGLIQLRKPLVAPRGEARSDLEIIFALATHLGLGEHFWNGDIDAALRHRLAPSGVTLERLRAEPAGVRVALEPRYRKFESRGFDTPTRKIELYSETLLEHGISPVPTFSGAAMSPERRPELAERYPLLLTSSKSTWFCESQGRGLPSLRKRALDPELEIHPETARVRQIANGDWVRIETPAGSVRARARFNPDLEPDVVCGQHGWWQACAELGATGYDAFGASGANLNGLFRHEPSDPTGGSVPHRSHLCNVAKA